MAAIEADGIDFSFGPTRVLRELTLHVERGESVAIFGPNGAGKTTLLKVLAALLKPDAGTVRIGGVEASADPVEFRRKIGVISHQPYVYPQLTGRENLEFYARLYGLADARAVAYRALEDMGLAGVADRQAAGYSRGMLQRLAIGRALLHKPTVLLLDEPFTGLDQQAREKLEALLVEARSGERTVVFTSHEVGLGLGLVDGVAVLAGGSLAWEARARDLTESELVHRYRSACGESGEGVGGMRL